MLGGQIADNPTPNIGDRPAIRGGRLNNAGDIPTAGSVNLVMSFRVPSPDPNRFTDITVNYTIAGKHKLDEGFVMRYGEIQQDGTLAIKTYGEGNAWREMPLFGPIVDRQVEKMWGGLDKEVIQEACNEDETVKQPCPL